MKPSYEELEKTLAEMRDLLKKALEEIARLKEQINLNSKNSSKAPSTDQKKNTLDKERKKRDSREGKSRILFSSDRIDRQVQCTQENCPHCGGLGL